MSFRNEHAAATTADAAHKKRNWARLAVLGGAVAALPVAGLVTATTASAASTTTWNAVAQCESSGNWSINTGNGFYGGLQFTSSTWAAYGGTQYASQANLATPAQQIAIAEKVLADQGPGAWPVCSVKAGLTAGGAPAQVDTSTPAAAPKSAPAPAAPVQQAPVKQNSAPAPKPAKPAAPESDNGHHGHKAASDNGGSYTVKSGDTLSAIAAAHGTDWHTLYQKNLSVIGANPNMIYPGQVLSF
ncbi:LysM peptidoglycan-binding domain-containing protein [Kitasatospora sp. RB6PN24]|uniref:LysM peptidoglycan-binding domain-containing protein n=1 Tax=Kitasatospora humi TaxID=2893891 RepID=UPI001E5DA0AF|nr:transglycosylase family protein [Kitasatospora humi]MCC9311126.1 LysM peptidoglycan-binding domain-containing protein [Kitasatospora humi]